MAPLAEVQSPGFGSLGDISCELASVEVDCERRQSCPETITDEKIIIVRKTLTVTQEEWLSEQS